MIAYKSKIIQSLILAVSIFPFGVQAGATAYATISANIVPVASASVSGVLVISKDSSSNASLIAKPAKVSIKGGLNKAYDISVSSTVKAINKMGKQLTIAGLNKPNSTTGNTETELQVNPAVALSNQYATGSYTGRVSITVNYN